MRSVWYQGCSKMAKGMFCRASFWSAPAAAALWRGPLRSNSPGGSGRPLVAPIQSAAAAGALHNRAEIRWRRSLVRVSAFWSVAAVPCVAGLHPLRHNWSWTWLPDCRKTHPCRKWREKSSCWQVCKPRANRREEPRGFPLKRCRETCGHMGVPIILTTQSQKDLDDNPF